MAANLPLYISAVPPPIPEADSVRYKVRFDHSPASSPTEADHVAIFSQQLCYNEDTKKMEFQRREWAARALYARQPPSLLMHAAPLLPS